MAPKQIAEQCHTTPGAVSVAATRGKWKALLHSVKANAVIATKPNALSDQSLVLKTKLALELTRDAQVLERSRANSLKQSSKRLAVMTGIVNNAKVLHGWGEEAPQTLVNIVVLNPNSRPLLRSDLDQPDPPPSTLPPLDI